jgi:putative tryptophan/tyrosine transport system substrate-binding protein
MKRRRALTAMLSALLCPPSVLGQQQRMPVIGVLVTHPPLTDPVFDYLRTGLKKFGYVDGKNIKIEARTAHAQLEQVPSLAEELVRLRPAAILVVNEIAVRALKKATSTIPIVMVGYAVNDPVASKLIESYARPGGNVTGLFSVDAVLLPKRLELLREAVPGISRIAVFWDSNFGRHQLDELQRAAQRLSLQLQPIDVRSAEDLEPAFKTATSNRAQALISTYSPVLWIHKARVAQFALEAKFPSISEYFQHVEAGGLMSYGSFGPDNWARAVYYVDRLLKGAKVAELPVEQVSTYRLAVNLKTAKALGIKLPESILLRADEVIR